MHKNPHTDIPQCHENKKVTNHKHLYCTWWGSQPCAVSSMIHVITQHICSPFEAKSDTWSMCAYAWAHENKMTETSTTHILTTYTHNLPATHLISNYLTNSLIFSFINKHPYIHSFRGGDQTNKKKVVVYFISFFMKILSKKLFLQL